MTASPRTFYVITCDDSACPVSVKGTIGETRAKLRKRLTASGWQTAVDDGTARTSSLRLDYCPDHTWPRLIAVSEALRRAATPSKLEDLSRPSHGAQRDAATAPSEVSAHETLRSGQIDAQQAKSGGRESGPEDQAAEREWRALHGLNHAHTDLPRPGSVHALNGEQAQFQPRQPDLSQSEDIGSRVTRRSRGMSATDGLGQVARSTTIRNGGWNGAAPSAGISAFNPVSPPMQAADERDVSAIEVAAAQPAMLVRFGHALRCAWHGRFRKHDHCLECGRANLYGGFRCKRCRGRTRAVSWFLRGRYWLRLRWPGTWYGGNPEHNPAGPAGAGLPSQPDAHPTAMGSDQLGLGHQQFAPKPPPSWAEVLIQRVLAAQWDGTRLLLDVA